MKQDYGQKRKVSACLLFVFFELAMTANFPGCIKVFRVSSS